MEGVVEPMDHLKLRHVAAAVMAIALTVAGGEVFAQEHARSPSAGAVSVNAILDAWVQHSSRIRSLSATLSRTHNRSRFGAREFIYEICWNDSGQAALNIEWVAGKDKTEFFDRVVWTGREVWQYRPHSKEIMVWPMDRIGEYEDFRDDLQKYWVTRWLGGSGFDLIFPALANPKDVDPLPFLVGMRETVARKLFKFELIENADPSRFVVRATPVAPDLKASYNEVLITLDRKRCLPVAVEYQSGWRSRDIRRYTILKIQLDAPIADSVFEPLKPKGWEIKSPLK